VTGPGFVHLHLHSSFSLLEGALPIARLAELAKSDRQPALALTDTGNLFGALEFSEKMASAGIQPIIGCSLAVDFGDEVQGRNGQKPAAAASPRAAGGKRGRIPESHPPRIAEFS
jgi:DNA polymerase III subunit alpha